MLYLIETSCRSCGAPLHLHRVPENEFNSHHGYATNTTLNYRDDEHSFDLSHGVKVKQEEGCCHSCRDYY